MVQAFKQISKSFNPSQDAFNSFLNTKDSQTILILGDDGAGKSTIAKQALVISAGSKKPNFNKYDLVQSMKRHVTEYILTLANIVTNETTLKLLPENEVRIRLTIKKKKN